MSGEHILRGAHGQLRLQSNGGMLGPAEFNLPGHDKISPLTCPDWSDHPEAENFVPMIRDLCGDFMCAPFGAPEMFEALPEHWREGAGQGMPEDPWFHGYSANMPWEITPDADDPTRATMTSQPPDPHPLARLERRVSLLQDGPGYQVELCITARRDVQFPLSQHPCFIMPKQPGTLRLEVSHEGQGWTYPMPFVPENAPVAVDTRFDSLNAVPRVDGGVIDLSQLPPAEPCEALLQLTVPDGDVRLVYEQEGYALRFTYDADLLPSLVLWISNHGRMATPFDGNFRTLGIEAVAGAFDLGPTVSNSAQNPIARDGVATTISMTAGQKLTTISTVSIEAL